MSPADGRFAVRSAVNLGPSPRASRTVGKSVVATLALPTGCDARDPRLAADSGLCSVVTGEEVRRRTKVIGRFPGETSCLTMAWAVMDLVIAGARGLGLTLPDRHAIAALIAARSVPQTEEQIA